MVVTCVIKFDDNPSATYFAGQQATGKITLNSNKAKKVKGVILKINGFAHTKWSETVTTTIVIGNGATTTLVNTINHTGHEDYIASKRCLLGSKENQPVIIEPGRHTYPFTFQIPIKCPTSFEGEFGHVRYMVRVVLVRPWKFNQSFTKGFTVLKMMDLNLHRPLLKMPAHFNVKKTFSFGPFKSDPLKMRLSLPQSGYVPGQKIPVSLLVANDSRIDVEEIKVELVMIVVYHTQKPSKQSKNQRIVLIKLKKEGVLRHCNKLFHYRLAVPATPPTCKTLCKIIQIFYQIEVEAKVKGLHKNQKLHASVTIGNVPLKDIEQPTSTSSGTTKQPLQGGNKAVPMVEQKSVALPANDDGESAKSQEAAKTCLAVSPPYPWASDTNIPPPSYEEATHMQAGKINADEEHDYGEKEFSPRYPVFNIPSPNAPPAETDGEEESEGAAGYTPK